MKTVGSNEVAINGEGDIVLARKAGRDLAESVGFGTVDCIKIATAISELARNVFLYAGTGRIVISTIQKADGRYGIEIRAEDSGPGIEDIEAAMQDGFSTGAGLGFGLPGTRRLMDEFDLQSQPGRGTVARARKWLRER